MQRYRSSAHSAWPQTTSNVWQPCRAPTCCPGIAWFAGGARRARSGGTHAAWAMQTEAMARSRREGSACSGVRARLENAAPLPRHWQAAHAISNTRAPASSALRLPARWWHCWHYCIPRRAPRAPRLLLLPAGPALVYQAGRHKLSMLPRY